MTQLVENRSCVVPGQALADGEDLRPDEGTFQEDGAIRSRYLGTAQFRDGKVRVTPVRGRYIPQKGDSVIGEISRVSYSNWTVDLNSPYDAILPVGEAIEEYVDLAEDDLADWFDIGDAVVGKVQKVTKGKDVQLSMQDRLSRKIEGGRIITVSPTKVPRLIGRGGTMVKTIKSATGTRIVIGQNGRVWVKGEKEGLAARACKKVEREANRSGLTDIMKDWLREHGGEF